jgi:tripartite-type tricarboxylate transporter receptor subunit TctC
MRRIILVVILLLTAVSAQAQVDFPNKPVTIIVPFPAGGSSDSVTRALADELGRIWKQNIVIDNKAGGGTVVGNTLAARARPDGYTMLMVSGSFAILPGIRQSLPYDPLKDFTAVSVFIDAPLGVVASPNFAPNTLGELIEEAKKRPDRPLTYASAGAASTSHMIGELLQRQLGIKLKHIPYTGEGTAIPDVLTGRVDFQMGTWSVQRPYVQSGQLKLLAVMSRTRLPEVPNTPTLNEAIQGLHSTFAAFNQILVPAGTPKEIVTKISDGIRAAVATDSFRQRILTLGSYPRDTTPEEADAFLKNEITTWGDIAKAAGIRVD